MEAEEVLRLKKSIMEAKETLKQGRILDPEAASQLRRMIGYYEEKVERYESTLNTKEI